MVKGGKGPADAMSIEQIPKPAPSGGQALVKIKAFGLNRMDLLQREGRYPLPPQAPETMGVEFSGTVESIDADAESGFKVGDAVFGLAYGGWPLSLTPRGGRLLLTPCRSVCRVHRRRYGDADP